MRERDLHRFPRTRRTALAAGVLTLVVANSACGASNEATETYHSSQPKTITDVSDVLPVSAIDIYAYNPPRFQTIQQDGKSSDIPSLQKEGPWKIVVPQVSGNCTTVFVPKGETVSAVAISGRVSGVKTSDTIATFCKDGDDDATVVIAEAEGK